MKKRTKIIIGVVIAGILAAAVVPRFLKPAEVTEQVTIPVVKAEIPQTGTITLSKEVIGTVEPSDIIYVMPKVAGEILEIYVNPGDIVEAGQPLCRIDNKQIDSSKISLDAAKVAMDTANANLARMQVLYASGDISAQAFEQVQTSAQSASLQYDGAKLAYDLQVEYSTVTAPIAGKIESSTMALHNTVAQSSQLCVITGEGGKKVTFSVADSLRNALSLGDEIVMEKQGTEYAGTVTEIGSMVNPQTGLFDIEASVDNGETLAPGVKIQLSVVSDKSENVMTLPVDCVYYDGGNAYVYTYENGTVHKVPVEVGIYDSERAEIVSGISADNLVITTWTSELTEGAAVTLQETAAETKTETAAGEHPEAETTAPAAQ
ncbi:MAG: efflux RND transporter periplasmic adaptor subunit [Lachnospiraceae bacterium]|jgi:RND family efflux transporter MFP subunit